MAYSKRSLVTQAYEHLGYAQYVFDLEPENLRSALRSLNQMMSYWTYLGVRLGYQVPESTDGDDLDDSSGIPDMFVEAVATNLSIRLAPSIGKTVTPELARLAHAGYRQVLIHATKPTGLRVVPGMPRGAGNRGGVGGRFTQPGEYSLDLGTTGELELE